jgi:hypothetical protein
MPYEVSFDKIERIVKVRVSGPATRDDHFSARNEALRLCQENRCSRLLVDLHELNTEHVSTGGCFTFGESVVRSLPGIRLAHVLPKDARSREDVKFTSTVEANRGGLVREFDGIEEARGWLLEGT